MSPHPSPHMQAQSLRFLMSFPTSEAV
jgi:hypothetical protein